MPHPTRKTITATILVTGALTAVGTVALQRLARAAGDSGGSQLSFSGRITGDDGSPRAGIHEVAFTFRNANGLSCELSPVEVDAAVDTGAFTALLDVGDCPPFLFQSKDVAFDVTVDGAKVVVDAPIARVPGALHADTADHLTEQACPRGHVHDTAEAGFTLCRRGDAGSPQDEMVKVGTGASAFWVDRYEASVWHKPQPAAADTPLDGIDEPYPSWFPENGAPDKNADKLYALSVAGVVPSREVTWFQANLLCRNSGKQLPDTAEWILAASGTPDPGVSASPTGECLTAGTTARPTGAGNVCRSYWGAEDMVGNLGELTAEWEMAPGDLTVSSNISAPWPSDGADYQNSQAHNLVGTAASHTPGMYASMPAVLTRGSVYNGGEGAGVYAITLYAAPSYPSANLGFRCVVSR